MKQLQYNLRIFALNDTNCIIFVQRPFFPCSTFQVHYKCVSEHVDYGSKMHQVKVIISYIQSHSPKCCNDLLDTLCNAQFQLLLGHQRDLAGRRVMSACLRPQSNFFFIYRIY